MLQMRGIEKSFGAVHVLRGVDLDLAAGEVLGLVGDNGAGKSTLMKVLSGAYRPDAGSITLDGAPLDFSSPMDGRLAGIETVYQDFALADDLDVASNVFLGRELYSVGVGNLKVMRRREMERRTVDLLDRLRIDVGSVRKKVRALSGGQRQSVAIARATAFDARIVIMDEPTAAMSVATIDKIIDLIAQLKASGTAVVLISHRLEDIHRVGDRVVVLRHGRKVGELGIRPDIHEFREEVVAYMIGARTDEALIPTTSAPGGPA